jgi:hypothetical protein
LEERYLFEQKYDPELESDVQGIYAQSMVLDEEKGVVTVTSEARFPNVVGRSGVAHIDFYTLAITYDDNSVAPGFSGHQKEALPSVSEEELASVERMQGACGTGPESNETIPVIRTGFAAEIEPYLHQSTAGQ